MIRRSVPSSLIWLAALVALAVLTATIAGVAIYLQTRSAAETQASAITNGDVSRGRAAIGANGCGACHVIPDIAGANGRVGPDLTHVAQRATIAGTLPNDPATMTRWLMHPQHLSPGSAMPEQGLSERQARDIAAYLYSRR